MKRTVKAWGLRLSGGTLLCKYTRILKSTVRAVAPVAYFDRPRHATVVPVTITYDDGRKAKQSAELGATITQVTTGDAAGNDEALIVLIVGRESIAGAKRALDEWENGRPAPKRRTRAKREGGKRG